MSETRRMLIVENHDGVRKGLLRLFGRWKELELLSATDGSEALKVLEKEHVDLIFTDLWMMPMNGFELIDALREDPRLADIPVMMLTSEVSPNARIEALKAGVIAFNYKPMRVEEMTDLIGGWLADQGIYAETYLEHQREIAMRPPEEEP